MGHLNAGAMTLPCAVVPLLYLKQSALNEKTLFLGWVECFAQVHSVSAESIFEQVLAPPQNSINIYMHQLDGVGFQISNCVSIYSVLFFFDFTNRLCSPKDN